MLLTTINNGGAGADTGGCWRVIGRRLIGSSGNWSVPITLEVEGVTNSYGYVDILFGGDNPEVTDWFDCDYEYALTYGNLCGTVPNCYDTEFYIFDVSDCCGCNPPDLIITDYGSCWLGPLSGTCVTSGSAQYYWERSCDGINWATYAFGPNLIQVTDSCYYRVSILNCADGCYRTSNVLQGTCGGTGCMDTLNVGKTGCDFIRLNNPCGNGNHGNWTIFRNGNIAAFSGTGLPPSVTTITTDGNYHMVVECLDGCVYESGTLSFNGCGNDCTCQGNVTFNPINCTLIFANPDGCDSGFWSYQWQFASASNGSPANIFGATGLSHAPTTNGFYWFRLRDNSNSCPDVLLGPIQVNCVQPPIVCNCTASISGCNPITLTTGGDCSEYTIKWQRNTGSGWSTVAIGGTTYAPTQTADYRVRMDAFTSSDCSDVYTNQVNCGFPQCSPTITSMTINNDCDIVVTWAGCNGTPSNIQWSWFSINNVQGNCDASGGINSSGAGTVVTNALANGTGTTTLTPAQGTRGYRVLIDCGGNGCTPWVDQCIWWEEPNYTLDVVNINNQLDGCNKIQFSWGVMHNCEDCCDGKFTGVINNLSWNPRGGYTPPLTPFLNCGNGIQNFIIPSIPLEFQSVCANQVGDILTIDFTLYYKGDCSNQQEIVHSTTTLSYTITQQDLDDCGC